MKWASAMSRSAGIDPALEEVVAQIREQLGADDPDLGVIFCSPDHRPAARTLLGRLNDQFPTASWLGCTGGGVIAARREATGGSALGVAAAHLPGVRATTFHLGPDDLPTDAAASAFWHDLLEEPDQHVLLLPDPLSCDVMSLVGGLDAAFPDGITFGGLASGGEKPGENLLFVGNQVCDAGAVGVGLTGDLEVETIVAQGCRPIGNPLFVTATNGPFITQIDGRKPLEVLEEIFETLSDDDQELFRFSLLLGIVMRDDQVEYARGDFLIRNLAGIEPDSGAIAVGAVVQPGQVVQFHLRDASTSADDLEGHLVRYAAGDRTPPAGGFLFSCLGRGEFLYGEPDHDSRTFERHVGKVPIVGFFCNGEIGPVQGQTFVHGYTSVFALFRPASR